MSDCVGLSRPRFEAKQQTGPDLGRNGRKTAGPVVSRVVGRGILVSQSLRLGSAGLALGSAEVFQFQRANQQEDRESVESWRLSARTRGEGEDPKKPKDCNTEQPRSIPESVISSENPFASRHQPSSPGQYQQVRGWPR